jgi:hypothetical protein
MENEKKVMVTLSTDDVISGLLYAPIAAEIDIPH